MLGNSMHLLPRVGVDQVIGCAADALVVADKVSYKQGWAVEARAPHGPFADIVSIRLSFIAPCAVTGKQEVQVCATHLILVAGMTVKSFLNRILWAIKQAEEHETLEFFKYQGVAIYDPHQ